VSATWSERSTADGSWTLWNESVGEACHSSSGAWQQATERYARACGLRARAERDPARAVRVLDIGTGLGLNLAAALAEVAPAEATLAAHTFELDPEVIERGLALYERAELRDGPWERWHAPVRRALRAALDAPGTSVEFATGGSLVLHLGDARTALGPATDGARCDAAFLDPFSPRRAGELWEEDFLARVAAWLAPEGWLSTYSAAVRVRLALARAGLNVGRGPRVGAKGEGTLASPTLAPPALAARLARRLASRAMGKSVP
jgi:tRNA U34 5-methylaminomethyl-2-thiouridine-forming methyltransferase MnmC